MSEPRGLKRPLEDRTTTSPPFSHTRPTPPHTSTTTTAPTTRTTSKSLQSLFAQQQLDTLTAELEHERRLRLLDAQRHQQTQARLEQQLLLATQQVAQTQESLQELQTASDKIVAELQNARHMALAQVRVLQEALEDAQPETSRSSTPNTLSESQCARLERRVATLEEEERTWRQEVDRLRQALAEARDQMDASGPQNPTSTSTPALEEAPPAVMMELARVRRQLAETERRERQAHRRIEELERRNQSLRMEREQMGHTDRRVQQLQKELQDMTAKQETLVAQATSWQQWNRQMGTLLKRQNIALCHEDGLPEVATMVRYMEDTQMEMDRLANQVASRSTESLQWKEQVNALRIQVRELEAAAEEHTTEQSRLHKELVAAQHQATDWEAKASIYWKETESLRDLIKTFDNMPVITDQSMATKLDTSLQTMQVRLASLQEELKLAIQERDRLASRLEQSLQSESAQTEELHRVRQKFEKLKDALYAERAKVEQAEARANQAEALAGKGAFNPETTRVLHLKESPLTEALKEEIKVLRRQVEAMGESKGKSKVSRPALDPEKLHQRLKESFKEQIALFREGVYLMTGFKVDMLPVSDEQPTFRVRSMFAERETDHLMLRYPQVEEGPVKSLDILGTEFAKELTGMPLCYQYVTKFNSIPAFLASVQLALFEKQTMML